MKNKIQKKNKTELLIRLTKEEIAIFDTLTEEAKAIDKKLLTYRKKVKLHWELLRNKYFLSNEFTWIYNLKTSSIEKLGVNPNATG